LERSIARVAKQSIATGVTLEVLPHAVGIVVVELPLIAHPIAGRRKHIADMNVHEAVIVVVAPGNTHARGDVLDTGLGGNVDKPAGVLALQTVAAEVVGNVQVHIAIVVEIFPTGRKRVAGVVLIQANFGGNVFEGPLTLIAEQPIAMAIVGIVIRYGGAFAAGGSRVTANLEVQIAVVIKVGRGERGSGPDVLL
jgi:hypothetical protein